MAEFDIVIHGGRLIDGTGNPWFYGDVAIKGGKIAGIGKIDPDSGQRSISAKGRVVTPGYIDMHTHSDQPLIADGNAESKVRQGVTLTSSAKARRWRLSKARSWKNIAWSIASGTASRPTGRRLRVTSTP